MWICRECDTDDINELICAEDDHNYLIENPYLRAKLHVVTRGVPASRALIIAQIVARALNNLNEEKPPCSST